MTASTVSPRRDPEAIDSETPTILSPVLLRALLGSGVEALASDSWRVPSRTDQSAPWVAVHTEVHRAVVGPVVRPDMTGCPTCYTLRRERAESDRPWLAAVREEHRAALENDVPTSLDPLAADVIARVTRLLAAEPIGDTRAVYLVDLRTLNTERRTFLPDPLCPDCGQLPADTAQAAKRELVTAPKLRPYGSRTRDVVADLEHLRALYVDEHCGMIRRLDRGDMGGLVMAGAQMPLRFDNLVEPGYGRSRDYRTSEATAILEALERYGGVAPGGRRTVVRGNYRDLSPDAVHPDVFGRHPDESYNDPAFRYRRFDDEQAVWWVWAHSLGTGDVRLVPESLAYYYCHRLRLPDVASYYEVSNGCALGSSWEEAALHGVLETVERDAFLCTWYTRTVPPRIDLRTCADGRVMAQAEAIVTNTGYVLNAFDITTDYGIPAVWVMALHPDGGAPAALCTAGAGLDVELALLNALSELGPILSDVIRRYDLESDDSLPMVHDPCRVVTMADHSALYSRPEALPRLEFLLGGPVIDVREVGGADRLRPHPSDLTADLRAAVERIGEALVVDQTTPEHAAGGFACVKVLVPGAVPMTFGYRNRRIDALPRLLELPRRLGRLDRDLRPDELNADPHPFP